MSSQANNEKELGHALKTQQSTMEIEGDLYRKVVRIRATGRVAWAVAIGAIGVAVVAALAAPETMGTSIVVSGAAFVPAVAVLGVSTTTAAVSIAVAAGGIGALRRLRRYKLEKTGESLGTLHRND